MNAAPISSTPPAPRRRRRAGRRILGALLLLLFSVVTAELLLERRAAWVSPLLVSSAPGRLALAPQRTLFVPFDVAEVPDSTRIVYVGASTEAGYPFGSRAAPAAWMARVLAARGSAAEVVAVAAPGLTSAETLALLPEVLALHPSAIIVGVGHNEYLRSGLRLDAHWWNRWRLGRWLATTLGHPPRFERQPTLLNDFDHAAVTAAFRRNVEAMQALADEAQVPLLFTVPVCNLADFPPLLGDDPRLPEEPDAAWQRGRRLLAAGDVPGARAAFKLARDTDRWPFRSRGPLIAAIEETARLLVRTDRAFDTASARGVPGFDLFLDNCHPNMEGLRVLALAVADALAAEGLVAVGTSPDAAPSVAELMAAAGLEDADVAAERAVLAREFVAFAVMTGRNGELASMARRLVDEALAAHATPGELETSVALLDLLAGDVDPARAHLAVAQAQAPDTLATLERAIRDYPWMAAVFERNGLAVHNGQLVDAGP